MKSTKILSLIALLTVIVGYAVDYNSVKADTTRNSKDIATLKIHSKLTTLMTCKIAEKNNITDFKEDCKKILTE